MAADGGGGNFINRASMGPRPFSRGNIHDVCILGPESYSLQWGHGLSAVEMALNDNIQRLMVLASMGPRPFSRGNGGCQYPSRVGRTGFNGATAFQPWKSASGATYVSHPCASMGPRPFSRGNCRRGAYLLDGRTASMGPRPFSRGNGPADPSAQNAPQAASMGPRPFSRGNKGLSRSPAIPRMGRFNGATAFQPWK